MLSANIANSNRLVPHAYILIKYIHKTRERYSTDSLGSRSNNHYLEKRDQLSISDINPKHSKSVIGVNNLNIKQQPIRMLSNNQSAIISERSGPADGNITLQYTHTKIKLH